MAFAAQHGMLVLSQEDHTLLHGDTKSFKSCRQVAADMALDIPIVTYFCQEGLADEDFEPFAMLHFQNLRLVHARISHYSFVGNMPL